MTVYKLQIQPDPAASPGLEALTHGRKSLLANQRRISQPQGIACTGSCEVTKQVLCGPIAHAQPVDVEHRVTQSRAYERVADVVHIEKAIDMGMTGVMTPCIPKLEQTVGTERRKREQAVFTKHPGNLGCDNGDIAYPRQQQVCEYNVDALIVERQEVSRRLYDASLRKPPLLVATTFQHFARQIDRHNFCATKALRQLCCRLTACAAKVDNDAGVNDNRCQSVEQSVPGHAVNEIHVVKSTRSTIEATAHVTSIKRVVGVQWRRLRSGKWQVASGE